MIPIVISVLVLSLFFYVTCTPNSKPLLGRVLIVVLGLFKYIGSFFKFLALRVRSVFRFLVWHTPTLILIITLLYIASHIFCFEKRVGFMEFIIRIITLMSFYSLLEDRRGKRMN